ncbi:hypothetical protein FRC11_014366 [Ceratobasidium sp. 423]|nr:hypothetical protein FRC11_014366 [Ceratobasidium sp. 423]
MATSAVYVEDTELAQRGLQFLTIGENLWPGSTSGNQQSPGVTFNNRVLDGKRVVFSARAVESDPNQDAIYRYRVEKVGGIYISGLCLGGNRVSREILESADVFITSYRDNEEYIQATKCNAIIGTSAWILHVSNLGLWSTPEEHLLHYPHPKQPALGFEGQMITITKYTGDAREYLKKLIVALGGRFTPSLSAKNTCMIASNTTISPDQPTHNKIYKAREWRVPIVNHLWLEDCFREWARLPVNDQKYLNFPQDRDWMQEINAGSL